MTTSVASQPNGTTAIEAHPSRPRSRDAIPIHHLLNSPPGDDFVPRFPIRDVPFGGTIEDDESSLVDAEDSPEASQWSEDQELHDPYVGAPDTAFEAFFDGLETLTFGHSMPTQDNILQPACLPAMAVLSSQAQALEPRAAEVRQALQITAAQIGNMYPECQDMLNLGPAIDQFTGAECDSLVNLFFDKYHRHCPIVHRPTFQPTLCPMPLFLSILSLGGMYAHSSDVLQRMKSLLDVIECYIFSLPGLRDEFTGSVDLSVAADEVENWRQFEAFQGAYLIIVAQYFSGNLAAKRRARRQRFTRVLDIARSFKLPMSQHPLFVAIPDELSFAKWVRNETRIRQMNIMLALDAAMAIFNNVPPRISFSELDLQLPCDMMYYEVASFSELTSRSIFPQGRPKLVDAFQNLFVAPAELANAYGFMKLNCWDMLLLIHCLYTHVWRQTYANPLLRSSPSTLQASAVILDPLKTAVRNWKTIWDDIRSSLTREEVKDMGFETSADSYWTITNLIVQRFEGKYRKEDSHSGSGPSITNGIASNDSNSMPPKLNISGHPTLIKQESIDRSMYAVPGSYVAVGMGNTMPIPSFPVNESMVGPVQNGYATPQISMQAMHYQMQSTSQPNQLSPLTNANGNLLAPMQVQSIGEAMPPPPHGKEALDFMPIETDFDSQGQHLRKILKRGR